MRHSTTNLLWRMLPRATAVLAGLVVALTASESRAAIALEQTVGTAGSQTTGTTLTVTVPAAGVAIDDTLIVVLAIDPDSGPVFSDDTGGNTYTIDVDVQNGSGTTGVRTVILSALVTSPLAAGDTITVTHPSVAARAVAVYEFSGVGMLDQISAASGNDANPSSGDTPPTSQDEELLVGAIGMEAKKTDPFTPGAGYLALVPETSGGGGLSSSNVALNAEYQVVPTAGFYAADGTIAATPWAAAIATYRAVTCGNGVVEPGEDCDDGNLDPGDCCDPTCLFEDVSVVCRDAVGDCDLPETCTGVDATCPPDEKSTDECRPAVDDCDMPEFCDGVADDCPDDALVDADVVCRDAIDDCDVPEACTGVDPSCPPDAFADPSVVCRDAVGDCDLPEMCSGIDPSCPPDEKSIDECRPAVDVCDVAESCDGFSDDCPPDAFEDPSVVCRDAIGDCDLPEACTGVDPSCPPDEKSFDECRPAVDDCDVAESCDGIGDDCPPDLLADPSVVCRDAVRDCDLPEMCTGDDPSCPPDEKSTDECRPAADDCDVAETCDGIADDCPEDAFADASVVCRDSVGECDLAETCTGDDPSCPPDEKSTDECRPATDGCDAPESCDGVGDDCPPDVLEEAGVVCRDAAGDCDLPETCAGDDPSCPPDEKSTDECRPAEDDCDVPETCDGVGDDCPPDEFADESVICRDAVGDCDLPETCTGTDASCPADEKSTDECRPAVDECDVPETCDGVADDCPPDTGEPDSDEDGVCDMIDVCPTTPDDTQDDADADGVGDVCDPCTNILPVFAERPKVKFAKLASPGRSKLKFSGVITVPIDPPIDPAAKGVRVLLQDVDAAPLLDVEIPGGGGWRAEQAGWRYSNPLGWEGITKVVIRGDRALPGWLKFQVVGSNGTYAIAEASLPLQGTVVIDSPYAGTGQCGEALFPGPPGGTCKFNRAGTSLRCK